MSPPRLCPRTSLRCHRVPTDEHLDLDDGRWEDIHVITGALKLFFRELPEPLVPFSHFDKFIAAISKGRRQGQGKGKGWLQPVEPSPYFVPLQRCRSQRGGDAASVTWCTPSRLPTTTP